MLAIGNICSVSSSMLIYVYRLFQNPKKEANVVSLDCSSWPPKSYSKIRIRPFSGGAPGMCYVTDGKKSAVVVAQNEFGLFAYNTQTGKPYWKLKGEPKGDFTAPQLMNFTAVTGRRSRPSGSLRPRQQMCAHDGFERTVSGSSVGR